MAEINLTQTEADALLALVKHRVDTTAWDYPSPGEKVSIPLVSVDRRESFLLDLSRGRINLAKGTYQSRGRQVVILARLDFGGPPHRNCISTARDTETSGLSQCQAINSRTWPISGERSKTSCAFAT